MVEGSLVKTIKTGDKHLWYAAQKHAARTAELKNLKTQRGGNKPGKRTCDLGETG